MKDKIKNIQALIKVAFFFPYCWAIGGTLVLVLLFMLGVNSPWPYLAYFIVGIAGTVWFARS
jgi:hypothetical protein